MLNQTHKYRTCVCVCLCIYIYIHSRSLEASHGIQIVLDRYGQNPMQGGFHIAPAISTWKSCGPPSILLRGSFMNPRIVTTKEWTVRLHRLIDLLLHVVFSDSFHLRLSCFSISFEIAVLWAGCHLRQGQKGFSLYSLRASWKPAMMFVHRLEEILEVRLSRFIWWDGNDILEKYLDIATFDSLDPHDIPIPSNNHVLEVTFFHCLTIHTKVAKPHSIPEIFPYSLGSIPILICFWR